MHKQRSYNMQCLYILLFVAVARGFVMKPREKRDLELQAPVLAGLGISADGSFKMMWNKVVSPDSSEPVLGYMVKVWILQDKIIHKYEIVDGKKVLVEETVKAEIDLDTIPTETPREIKIVGADTTEAIVKDTKQNVQYHFRVLAYTKNHQSPLSSAYGIRY